MSNFQKYLDRVYKENDDYNYEVKSNAWDVFASTYEDEYREELIKELEDEGKYLSKEEFEDELFRRLQDGFDNHRRRR